MRRYLRRSCARGHRSRESIPTLAQGLHDVDGSVSAEGALADLLLVDGNPLENLDLPAAPDTSLVVMMKDGVIYKNLLGS